VGAGPAARDPPGYSWAEPSDWKEARSAARAQRRTRTGSAGSRAFARCSCHCTSCLSPSFRRHPGSPGLLLPRKWQKDGREKERREKGKGAKEGRDKGM
jgi:hypothetical protein